MKRKQNLWMGMGLVFSLLFNSSCALFLVGGGVAGGIAISKDTIEGGLDKPLDHVWKTTREVIMQEGFIRLEDRPHGKIDAEVRKSQINIEILQFTQKTVRIRVKARKGYNLLPNIDLANELYNKIFQKLK